jgi:ZIP family zinc transporter
MTLQVDIQFNLSDPAAAGLFSLMSGIVPVLLGILIVYYVRGWYLNRRVILSGLSVGILGASFFDLVKETAGLSGSTLKSSLDLTNVAAFSAALLALLVVHRWSQGAGGFAGSLYGWAILGIGLHSLGEGVTIGYDFSTGFTLLSLPQVSSFLLHKVAEGLTIGALLYSSKASIASSVPLGIVAGIPVALGTVFGLTGLPVGVSTIFFAGAAGATLYAMVNLYPVDRRSAFAVAILLGFIYMYLSGVLHQFE